MQLTLIYSGRTYSGRRLWLHSWAWEGSNYGNWFLTSSKNTPESRLILNLLRTTCARKPAPIPRISCGKHHVCDPPSWTSGADANVDAITGETKATSMWIRHEGDIAAHMMEQASWKRRVTVTFANWRRPGSVEPERLRSLASGVMTGYGNEHHNADSVRTRYVQKAA